jgi:hypothetical protein
MPLSIQRLPGRSGNAPAATPGYRPLPPPDAANDPAAAASRGSPAADVALPRDPWRPGRYALEADDVVARVIAGAAASLGGIALLESVARLAALYA